MSRARIVASPALVQFEYPIDGDRTGTEDCSAAVTAALAKGPVKGYSGDEYLCSFTIGTEQAFYGNGARLLPLAGSTSIVTLDGYRPKIVETFADGFTENHVVKTTVTAIAAIGATTISVASTARFAPRMPVIVIQNGFAPHMTLISSVNPGAGTITIRNALTIGTYVNAEVFASFGMIRHRDATWAEISGCEIVNGAFSLMMVPSTGTAVTPRASIEAFDIDGENYCGFAKFDNSGDLVIRGMRGRLGKVFVQTFTGTGGAGPFRLSRPIYLYRNLKVRVNGTLQVYNVNYNVAVNGVDVTFLGGSFPALGATIELEHSATGLISFNDDQRCPDLLELPSGNRYYDIQMLNGWYNIVTQNAFLTDFTGTIADTAARANIVINNAPAVTPSLNFNDTFCGYAPDGVQVYSATANFNGLFDCNLVPAVDWHGAALGKMVTLDVTARARFTASQINDPDGYFSHNGVGELNLSGGEYLRADTSAIAAGATVYVGQNGVSGGPGWTMASRGRVLRLRALPASAPGSGQTFFYEVFKNGSATGLSKQITGSALVADIVGSIAYFPDDILTVQVVTSAGAPVVTHRVTVIVTT